MTAFISHSFEDQPEFDNVTQELQSKRVRFWSPAEIRAGASLREQLRVAVDRCTLCIFIATLQSVKSKWCEAELGAFWGAGKPILVYLADASLTEQDLPVTVRGDVWDESIKKIADRAKEIIDQSSVKSPDSSAAVGRTAPAQKAGDEWHNKILWVDDRPENTASVREAMQSMGLEFTLAWSTDMALKLLSTRRFAAIISDMGRKEGPREGYVLLEVLRATDRSTPFFIYAGSGSPEHRREAALRGAQGSTDAAGELVEMIIRSLRSRSLPLREPHDPEHRVTGGHS
jgi:CheY-like chemotaxis protein